jgi:hypothetical protein
VTALLFGGREVGYVRLLKGKFRLALYCQPCATGAAPRKRRSLPTGREAVFLGHSCTPSDAAQRIVGHMTSAHGMREAAA